MDKELRRQLDLSLFPDVVWTDSTVRPDDLIPMYSVSCQVERSTWRVDETCRFQLPDGSSGPKLRERFYRVWAWHPGMQVVANQRRDGFSNVLSAIALQMESRKACFKSRGPTAETRRILKAEESKKRQKADRSQRSMIRRDLQRSPLSKIQEEEPTVTKRKSQTGDEKRLAQRLVQWKKIKELERKKQMLQKQKPFILGSKNVIPKSPLPLPKMSKRKVNDRDKPSIVRRSTRLQDKAKVTTEQTNMKSWATGESGHRQTGKKNAQPSTFGKGNQLKDSKKHQLNTVMKTTEPAVKRAVVKSKPSSVLQSFQSQLDSSLNQQKSTVDFSSDKPFSPFQFSFQPLNGNGKFVNPYENRHEVIQSKDEISWISDARFVTVTRPDASLVVSPVFSNTSPALEVREKSSAPCDGDSQMYHESVSSVTPKKIDTIYPTVTSYLGTVETETEQLQSVCDKWKKVKEDEEELTEEVVGMIDTAIGKAQLLMSQKFAQFRQLCDLAKDASAPKTVKLSDLQGFWDMVQYQVEDVTVHFEHLAQLEENGWVIEEEKGTMEHGRKATKRVKKRELSAKTKATRRRRMQEFKAKMLAAKLKKEGDMPFQSGSGDYQLSAISTPPALKTVNILEYTRPTSKLPVIGTKDNEPVNEILRETDNDHNIDLECGCGETSSVTLHPTTEQSDNPVANDKEESICDMLSEFNFHGRESRRLPGRRERSSLMIFSPAGSVKKLAPVTPSKRIREAFTTVRFYSPVRRSIRLLSSRAMERPEDLPEGSVVLPNQLTDNL